jgi:Leu/Phe-tRNA-protein transferase
MHLDIDITFKFYLTGCFVCQHIDGKLLWYVPNRQQVYHVMENRKSPETEE